MIPFLFQFLIHILLQRILLLTIIAPGLKANDYHPQGESFNLSQFFSPSNGTLTSIVTSGAFTYVPDSGFAGVDTFTYRLRDSKGKFSDYITAAVEVFDSGLDTTIAIADAYFTIEGTTLSISAPGLSENDYDSEGESFLLSQFTQPSNGTITSIVTNGAFTYVHQYWFYRYRYFYISST